MLADVLGYWQDAPISELDSGGRWVRFERRPVGAVYIQRYAWDDDCRPDYLVAVHEGEEPTHQLRFSTLRDAVEAAQVLLMPTAVAETAARAAITVEHAAVGAGT